MQQPRVAISIDQERLLAVLVDFTGAKPRVHAWVDSPFPAGITASDTTGLGQWLRRELRDKDMLSAAKRPGIAFAVSRSDVVLKRLVLPATTRPAELPGVIRLQMLRQATVAGEELVIDFASIESSTGRAVGGEATHLAGAVSAERMNWRRAVCKAAGIRLAAVPLASAGYAALFRPSALRLGGATIGVAIGGTATEFVVLEEGVLAFARVVPGLGAAADDQDIDRLASRISVEAKRTWMAHRAAPQALPIETVCVLGTDELARVAATSCGASLEVPASNLPVDLPAAEGTDSGWTARMAPLLGSLIDLASPQASIDFAHPREAPDAAAAMRQRLLVAAFVTLAVGGSLATFARMNLARRDRELAELKTRWAQQSSEHAALIGQRARVQHLDRFRSDQLDWLAHLDALTAQLPPPEALRLDSVVMSTNSQVLYAKPRGDSTYADRNWTSRTSGVLTLSGSMASREVADGLRSILLTDSRYELESIGADVPNRFEFRLRTSPQAAATATKKPGGAQP